MKAIMECKRRQWIISTRKDNKLAYKLTTLGLVKLNEIVARTCSPS